MRQRLLVLGFACALAAVPCAPAQAQTAPNHYAGTVNPTKAVPYSVVWWMTRNPSMINATYAKNTEGGVSLDKLMIDDRKMPQQVQDWFNANLPNFRSDDSTKAVTSNATPEGIYFAQNFLAPLAAIKYFSGVKANAENLKTTAEAAGDTGDVYYQRNCQNIDVCNTTIGNARQIVQDYINDQKTLYGQSHPDGDWEKDTIRSSSAGAGATGGGGTGGGGDSFEATINTLDDIANSLDEQAAASGPGAGCDTVSQCQQQLQQAQQTMQAAQQLIDQQKALEQEILRNMGGGGDGTDAAKKADQGLQSVQDALAQGANPVSCGTILECQQALAKQAQIIQAAQDAIAQQKAAQADALRNMGGGGDNFVEGGISENGTELTSDGWSAADLKAMKDLLEKLKLQAPDSGGVPLSEDLMNGQSFASIAFDPIYQNYDPTKNGFVGLSLDLYPPSPTEVMTSLDLNPPGGQTEVMQSLDQEPGLCGR